jgi:acetolactate synthase-1/2/3 large subunit
MTARERARVTELEDTLEIPVVGMESPRGIADPSLGAFAEMLACADCVLLLGKRLDFSLRFGKAPAFASDCVFLQLDPEEPEVQRARKTLKERLEYAARAHAVSSIERLTHAARANSPRHSAWCAEVRDAIARRPSQWEHIVGNQPGRLHPAEALRALQPLLDSHAEAVFISDGGEFGQWAQASLTAPHRIINGPAGAIGPALPYAIGARCALPDAPIVAVLGDGTFGFHAAEIDTGVRYDLPFVAMIGNDGRWNAEYQIQLREYGAERARGCELRPTRYDVVAVGLGGYGELVEDRVELHGAIKRAQEAGKPACLNVIIEGVAAPHISLRARRAA